MNNNNNNMIKQENITQTTTTFPPIPKRNGRWPQQSPPHEDNDAYRPKLKVEDILNYLAQVELEFEDRLRI